VQLAAGFGERELARRTKKQRHAQPFFQPGDLLAHDRLRHAEPLGRAGEGTSVDDGCKIGESIELQSVRGLRRHCLHLVDSLSDFIDFSKPWSTSTLKASRSPENDNYLDTFSRWGARLLSRTGAAGRCV
jgi:hypothetical protein